MASTPDARPASSGPDGIVPFSLEGKETNADEQMLTSLRTRLRDLSAEFKSRLTGLLGDLAYQPDVDMRFLGVVMNFNEVYKPHRRKPTTGVTSREKEKVKRRPQEGMPVTSGREQGVPK